MGWPLLREHGGSIEGALREHRGSKGRNLVFKSQNRPGAKIGLEPKLARSQNWLRKPGYSYSGLVELLPRVVKICPALTDQG